LLVGSKLPVSEPTIAYIGLGANLGDAAAALTRAVQALRSLPQTQLLGCSPVYKTAPLDTDDGREVAADGHDYLNAVAALSTHLVPLALLDQLQQIEQAAGRERPYRNAPRTLDLDLLLYGDEQIASATLTVPHPRLTERAFVLVPLLALAPAIAVPGLGPAQDYLASVADQAISQL